MSERTTWQAELPRLAPSEWPTYLAERSGLPGRRANDALVAVAASVAGNAEVDALLRDGGEYPTMCAAAAVARRSDEPACEERARALAADERWRVREGVAIGLQLLGDTAPAALRTIVERWTATPEPLVQRAAVAAICEPRLLRTPEAAAAAIEACRRATAGLVALPSEERKRPDARTLRQALGYAWSVAAAADPAPGLTAFRALDVSDPDVAWIVGQNRRKTRLARLLPTT